MKKIFIPCILLFCLLAANRSSAINFTFLQKIGTQWQPIQNNTLYLYCRQDSTIEQYIGVQNSSGQKLCMYMGKAYIQQPSTTFDDGFCWDNCYPKKTMVSVGCLNFDIGQIIYNNFHITFDPGGYACETIIKYSVWPKNVTDSASLIVHYVSQPMGISEAKSSLNAFARPNPTQGFVTFSLRGNTCSAGQIIITDLLGRIVRTIPYSPGQQEVMVNLADLPKGIYLFCPESQNAAGHVGKVVVE